MKKCWLLILVFTVSALSSCTYTEANVVGKWNESELTCEKNDGNCGVINFSSDGSVEFVDIERTFFKNRLRFESDEKLNFDGEWELITPENPLNLSTITVHVESGDDFTGSFSFTLYLLYGNEVLTLGLPDDMHLTFKKSK